jgi:hypothetical protein
MAFLGNPEHSPMFATAFATQASLDDGAPGKVAECMALVWYADVTFEEFHKLVLASKVSEPAFLCEGTEHHT